MILNLKSSSISPFFQQTTSRAKRAVCNCSRSELISGAMTIDRTQVRLLFTDSGYGHIWSSDMQGCICRMLVNATENRNAGLPPNSITVDSSRIYWSNNKTGKVYSIAKGSADPSLQREEFSGIQHVWAIGFNLQPYPDAECLLLKSYPQTAQLISSSFNSLSLYLPGIQRADICEHISFPSLLYIVYYGLLDTSSTASNNSEEVLTTYNQSVVLGNLLPFRNYTVQVSAQNYYSRGVSSLGPRVVYQTAVGTPSAPMNVSAKAITPSRIDVSWLPPSLPNGHPLFYELRWKSTDSLSTITSECGTEASTALSSTIITAEPGKKHYITVRAYSSDCELYTDSTEISLFALPLPNNLTLLHMTSTSLTLLWLPPRDDIVQQHLLEYRQAESTQWLMSYVNETVSSREESVFHIQNLWPKTRYLCRLLLTYKEKSVQFIFPYLLPFTTLGDVPSVPGIPEVSHLGREIYEVVWDRSSRNNGYLDIAYELQMRAELDSSEWQHLTNTSTTQWIISSFSGNTNYEFRVRAFNEFGGSNFSRSNKSFYLPEAGALMDSSDDPTGIIIASSVAIVILLSVFMAIIYMIHLKKQQCKKMLQEVPNNELVSDLELATLQDLPYHANFVHETNALYNLNDLPTDEELLALPQIRREQIIVTRFLGSGAFGEVFEGIANGMSADGTTLKIAIKTLKKGATDHEKEEFLKEAKLMSNFKHDHILQLLGVCFDNNPNFIILELMEGGDLLSFLRSNRPTMFEPSRLTLDNLVGICIDVAKGCKYLEDMHFVHRDLAARNCLVSSHDGNRRIVKIGDFGLARDIYKNDYYRKEGEGLLPVRWMSPESLVYGVFTSQSDVWAFGVLLYEVMTLGMQPYPARSNMEVLYYVRAGGRLDKPENCPEDLYELMVGCWSFDPERRPTFCYCLHELQDTRGRLDASATIMSTVYNLDYFGHENIGTYIGQNCPEESDENKLLDQNFDSRSIQSVPPSTSDRVLEENPSSLRRSLSWTSAMLHGWPASGKRSANKYLELLGDNEDSDGYQMPLPAPPARSALSNDMASLTCCESLNCEESCDISLAPLERTEIGEEEDNWSFSTASTATCPFEVGSPESEVTFALSCMAGIDLNHPSNSSYC